MIDDEEFNISHKDICEGEIETHFMAALNEKHDALEVDRRLDCVSRAFKSGAFTNDELKPIILKFAWSLEPHQIVHKKIFAETADKLEEKLKTGISWRSEIIAGELTDALLEANKQNDKAANSHLDSAVTIFQKSDLSKEKFHSLLNPNVIDDKKVFAETLQKLEEKIIDAKERENDSSFSHDDELKAEAAALNKHLDRMEAQSEEIDREERENDSSFSYEDELEAEAAALDRHLDRMEAQSEEIERQEKLEEREIPENSEERENYSSFSHEDELNAEAAALDRHLDRMEERSEERDREERAKLATEKKEGKFFEWQNEMAGVLAMQSKDSAKGVSVGADRDPASFGQLGFRATQGQIDLQAGREGASFPDAKQPQKSSGVASKFSASWPAEKKPSVLDGWRKYDGASLAPSKKNGVAGKFCALKGKNPAAKLFKTSKSCMQKICTKCKTILVSRRIRVIKQRKQQKELDNSLSR
jgi:hypothetical protein